MPPFSLSVQTASSCPAANDTFPVPRMVVLREWQRQEDLDLSVFEI
ncbi:hypothetical protein [Neisseria elongata]|nr:hypothetical protein [Neisseria elongata]